MNLQHEGLADGRWEQFSLIEQLANIGSDVHRAINWKKRGRGDYAHRAAERALELFDLTLSDPKNRGRLKEVARAREMFADYFFGLNDYNTTDESWIKYFFSFNYAARAEK